MKALRIYNLLRRIAGPCTAYRIASAAARLKGRP